MPSFFIFLFFACITNVNAGVVGIDCSVGSPLDITQGVDFSNGDDLTLTGAGTCVLTNTATLASLTVGNSSDATVLTHTAETGEVDVTTTGNLSITTSASIDADAKGCASTQGPNSSGVCGNQGATADTGGDGGEGDDDTYGGGGAGHGGTGGIHNGGSGTGGGTYGSSSNPDSYGSGGGVATLAGGAGGGKIRLTCSGTLDVSGTITSNGGGGPNTFNQVSGGGSGGSIYLNTATLTGAGTIAANGGTAYTSSASGGSGGGGRIAVYFNNDSRTAAASILANTTATSGTHSNSTYQGSNGTVIFVYDPSDDSSPLADTYPSISDDTIEIKNGFDFQRSTSGTLSFEPAALEISSVDNLYTSSNVTGLTLTFTTSDDNLATEGFIGNTMTCNSATSLTLNFTGDSSGDSSVRYNGNTITCASVALGFTSFTAQTLDDTVTTTATTASSISVTSTDDQDITFSGATYTAPGIGTSNANSFSIVTGGVLTLTSTSTLTGNLDSSVVTELDIASGSSWVGSIDIDSLAFGTTSTIAGDINSNGKGCPSTQGPDVSGVCGNQGADQDTGGNGGEGDDATPYGGGGAGYGGAGGRSSSGAGTGGGTYGSSSDPDSFGSGGGIASQAGGAGGGKIRLTSLGTIDISGDVTSNGGNGANVYNQTSGGGSGGSIYLNVATLTGAGTITANGGSAYENGSFGAAVGGSGGGGRIAIWYATDSSTADDAAVASKGVHANATYEGVAGTLSLLVPPAGLADLIAASNTSTTATLTWTAATDASFDHYEIWWGTNQSDVQNRTGTATEWDDSDDGTLATATTATTTITGLTANTAYYYKIWAIDTDTAEATISDITGDTNTGDPTGLADFVKTSNTATAIVLGWTIASDDTFDHYEIWYGESQSDVQNRTGTATEWDDTTDDTDLAVAATDTTTITGLTTGTSYYFKIWAIDTLAAEITVSDISATISVGGGYSGTVPSVSLVDDSLGGVGSEDDSNYLPSLGIILSTPKENTWIAVADNPLMQGSTYIQIKDLQSRMDELASDSTITIYYLLRYEGEVSPVYSKEILSNEDSKDNDLESNIDEVSEIGSKIGKTLDFEDGTLFMIKGADTVYYYSSDGYRHVFMNEKIFYSYYSDFDDVKFFLADEVGEIPLGENKKISPGTKMVKINTDPKVYAVEPGGVLRWVTTEEIAEKFYGPNWNEFIVDIDDSEFQDYTISDPIVEPILPDGTLVHYELKYYYVIDSNLLSINESDLDVYDARKNYIKEIDLDMYLKLI